jgi:hypothetical protein
MLQALSKELKIILKKLRYIFLKGITQITKPEYNWFFNFTNYFIKQQDKERKKNSSKAIV